LSWHDDDDDEHWFYFAYSLLRRLLNKRIYMAYQPAISVDFFDCFYIDCVSSVTNDIDTTTRTVVIQRSFVVVVVVVVMSTIRLNDIGKDVVAVILW
jgi:hypothetical protein